MFNLLFIAMSMSAPLFKVGDTVIVQDSEFANCSAIVAEVYEPPGQNRYDVDVFKCPTRWFKGMRRLKDVPENFLSLPR
jgi:hypothetical protein